LRVTYNRETDTAYIELSPERPGRDGSSYMLPPGEIGTMIHLDFSASGQLLGVEVRDASRFVPEVTLREAERQTLLGEIGGTHGAALPHLRLN
jgi:uncharacterized protein YuzE